MPTHARVSPGNRRTGGGKKKINSWTGRCGVGEEYTLNEGSNWSHLIPTDQQW